MAQRSCPLLKFDCGSLCTADERGHIHLHSVIAVCVLYLLCCDVLSCAVAAVCIRETLVFIIKMYCVILFTHTRCVCCKVYPTNTHTHSCKFNDSENPFFHANLEVNVNSSYNLPQPGLHSPSDLMKTL